MSEYADMAWKSRWNDSKGITAGISQSGSDITLFTIMGTIRFDLASSHNDIESFCSTMTGALELLKRTKQEYDNCEGKKERWVQAERIIP